MPGHGERDQQMAVNFEGLKYGIRRIFNCTGRAIRCATAWSFLYGGEILRHLLQDILLMQRCGSALSPQKIGITDRHGKLEIAAVMGSGPRPHSG